MFICDLYQAYLDDDTDELPYPCENCAAWVEKTDECLYETIDRAQAHYQALKQAYPIKTTVKDNCDIQAMVKKEFPDLYNRTYALALLDWNDLDGVLDYLYGHYNLFDKELKPMIDFIEARCEVKK